MKEEFTSEALKEIIKKRGLKYEIDDYYTAISQEHKFTDVVSDVHRNQPVHFSSDQDALETLILKSAILWNSDYLDPFDSRFKHNWERNGLKFIVPAHISETDFTNQDTKLRIMAANIAFAANKKFKCESDFEQYQKSAQKYPGRLDFSGDRMVAMSLLIIYESNTDRYLSFNDLLECYLQGEWSRKWLELHVLQVFRKVEKNINSDFSNALKCWGNPQDDLFKYYPISVHYSDRYNAYRVAEFVIEDLIERKEDGFQQAISSVVSAIPHIEEEIKELKRRHFSPYPSFDDNLLYRTQREDSNDVIVSNADFEEILQWCERKAAASFIYILEDRLSIGGYLRSTDLTLDEFSNLAFFLNEIDLFKSPKDASHHLSCFFTGVNKRETNIPLRWNTLRKLKDVEVIDELKIAFNKIRKYK